MLIIDITYLVYRILKYDKVDVKSSDLVFLYKLLINITIFVYNLLLHDNFGN
jgi:hypothetical protein